MNAFRTQVRPRRAVRRRQHGATVVEMALVLPAFLLLLIGVIELSLMFFVNLTMQHAVREGARYAITGASDADPSTASKQRYLAVIERMKYSAGSFYTAANPVITTNNITYTDSSSYNAAMFGKAGDILVIKLDCEWPLATPLLQPFFTDGKYRFTVAVTMLNENYAGVN